MERDSSSRERHRARRRSPRTPGPHGRARSRPPTGQRYERHVAEIFDAFGMDLDTPGTRDTPERFLRALYDATAGYDGDPKLLTAFPAESDGARRRARPDHRGADRVPAPLRAPRAAVLRLRAHRLHRRRADHRHLEADAARAPLRAALHGAGAARRADRRRARRADRAARRRGAPRGVAPLHADARRRGALADGDDVLARRLRGPELRREFLAEVRSTAPELLLRGGGARPSSCPTSSAAYGGPFGLRGRCLFANFVTTIDGVVAIPGCRSNS